jgi:hypothetical protein
VVFVVVPVGVAGICMRHARVLVSGSRVIRGGDVVAGYAALLRMPVVICGLLVMFRGGAIAIVLVMRHSGLDERACEFVGVLTMPRGGTGRNRPKG